MGKIFKTLLISLLLMGNMVEATESSYVIETFDRCSVENKCADVLRSVKNIKKPVEVDIIQLGNLIETPHSIYTYNVPEAVLEYPQEHIYKKSSFEISIIDPHVGEPGVNENYPGLRSANQLVIYTPEYGIKTGTNEFGAEATVINNTVVKLSGADSIIPKDGFVISGHGVAKTWIQNNIILGSKIYINSENMRIVALVTPETYIFEANEKIKETSSVLQYYKMMDPSYDGKKAVNYLIKASEYIKKAQQNPNKAHSYLKQSKENVEFALEYALPYHCDEFKGIWIRPTETNEKEIARSVAKLKKSGINNVFLETYYHGKTIYPSEVLQEYGVTSQRGEFIGFDPLRCWIEECRQNNIKLHVWFECFYVGNAPPRSSMHHILSVYPNWANTTKALADTSEIASSGAEHNGYFIDPANPEVQKFVGDVLTEIVEKYSPDGINLDYIRYPQCAQIKKNNSSGTEWGYTKYARDEFMKLYGEDPLTLSVSNPLRKVWFEYRQNKITDFVKFARGLTEKTNVTLTTVVFPDRMRSAETKLQDWKTWSKNNLVDGFTPLLLTTDRKTAGSLVRQMKLEMSPSTKIYPGLFVMFMGGSTGELLMQIHEMRKMRSNGVIFFDYAHLQDMYIESLSVRAFNSKD